MRALAAAVLTVLGTSLAWTQPATTEERAVAQFADATRRYLALHRLVEMAVPLEINSDPEAINRSVRHLAAVLRAERRGARPGELFTGELATILRARIARALDDHGLTPGDVMMAEAAEGVDSAAVLLSVNETFPWPYATGMFPCLLEALPELPPELQYRLVGHTLVLVDVHASLVVDLLPYALPAAELR